MQIDSLFHTNKATPYLLTHFGLVAIDTFAFKLVAMPAT